MSVIIRLQGLPWSASALDIRHFFKGLTIPAGGVHIIGGDRGDAFIAFSSDEDARQAMMRSMAPINGSPVQLYLSSKSEMQNIIEEARSADSGGGGGAAAPAMQQPGGIQQGGMQQGGMQHQQGMTQGFQGQQGFPGGQGPGNQRFPQQGNFQMGRDMNQGQFPGNQQFPGQGRNQMQGQMQGQQMPGQPGRDNQFGMQGNQNQGMNQQQNVPMGQQQTHQGGSGNQGMPGNMNQTGGGNRFQQNQMGGGHFGFEGEGNYGGGNYNQWQNAGPMQGQNQGPGPDFRANQLPGSDNLSQNKYNNQQGGQQLGFNQMGRDGQFPPRSQQFPGHGADDGPKPDNYGNYNQQGSFGQEGLQPGPGNNNRFFQRPPGGRPGPPGMNRAGILPLPASSGQVEEQPGGRLSDPKGQFPQRPGSDSRGTPDNHSRSPSLGRSDSQPPVDQWPGMIKGPDQRRLGGPEDSYPPQGMDAGLNMPTGRGGRFPPVDNMQQGETSGDARGRGILPTPNMQSGPQTGYSNEPFNEMGNLEQKQWPDYGGDEQGGRGGTPGDSRMGPNRDNNRDPDFRKQEPGRGPGQFREGGDSDFRGPAQGGGRFDGPGAGMNFDGGPEGMLMERGPGNRSMERGPDSRPMDVGFGRRSLERGTDRVFDRGLDGRSMERDSDGGPLDRGQDSRFFDRDMPGQQFEGDQSRSFERGPEGRSLDRGPDGRPLDRGPDGRPLDRGPDGRPLDRGPDGRPLDRGPDGRPLDRGPDGRPLDRGPDGRPLDRGPDGRPLDRGPDGRPLDRGPDGRLLDRGPDGRSLDRGPDGRPLDRGPDGRPLDRGPDGRPLDRGPDGRPLDRGPDGRPLDRGPDGRPLDRGPDGRPLDRGPDGRPFNRNQGRASMGREEERDTDGRAPNMQGDRDFDRGPFGGPDERPFDRYRGRNQDGGSFEHGPRFDTAEERYDDPSNHSRFDGPTNRSRFDAPGRRFDGPPDQPSDGQFPLHDTYDPMDMDIEREEFEEPDDRLPQNRRYPDSREFGEQDRGFDERGGRGFNRNEGSRGWGGGFDQERGRGPQRDFQQFGDEGRDYEDRSGEGMHSFGDEYGNQMGGDRDFDSRRDGGRGRGGAPYGRGFGMDGRGRMDGPRGRMERGRGRFGGPGRGFDTDRRRDGPPREEMDFRGRDRFWPDVGDDHRGGSKGLLGDAPTGIHPFSSPGRDNNRDSRSPQQRDSEPPRDRDRRSYSDRRERDDRDRGREDRFGRRSDRRRSRDRSSERDRHSRRGDRDRDRGDRRDRDRDRERDRSSHNRDRDSRSKDITPKESSSKDSSSKEASSKELANQKKDVEKDSGKPEVKSGDQKEAESDNSQRQESKYIHVQGFPTGYNYREIRRFFFGCELPFDGIKIINDIKGQRTGEAYMKFFNEETAKRAMRKSGETIFGKPVTLTYTTSKVFESQVDSQAPPVDKENAPSGPIPVMKKEQEKSSLIVMIKGLPFDVKREDIMGFFSSVKIADNGDALFIEYDIRNQATGVAYLEADSVQDFKTAIGHDGRVFANRNLQVSAGRREDMDLCIKKQQEMFQRQSNRMGDQQQQHGGAPSVMGPRPALMGPGPVRPGGPQNLMNMPGIPPRNGPAFEPGFPMQRQQQQPQPQHHADNAPSEPGQSYCVHIQGLPMLASYKDIREFFSGLEVVQNRGVQIVHDGMGKPMGEGFVEFATQEDKEKALKKDKTSMGRHILAVKSVAKGDMMERIRNARFVGLPPGQGPPNFPPHNMPEPPGGSMRHIPPGVLNRNWAYLSCQNFPPAVSITEIMGFFQGFNPIPESIRLHYAADGSPTGNAVVGFMNMNDSNRALQEMNGKYCRQNMVSLMPAM